MRRARRIPPSLSRQAVSRPHYCLADLLMESPGGAPIDVEWEAMEPVGREIEPAPASLRAVQAMKRFMRRQQRKHAGRGVNLRRLIDEGRA